MHYFCCLFACSLVAFAASFARAGEWLSAPSYFTHDPTTGQRVTQYSPIGPVYANQRDDYQQSAYRHYESDIQVGRTADRLHIVEEWGRPVRPYGEWKHPFRPYSVPYGLWGPPYGGLGYPAYYPGPVGVGLGYDRGGPGHGGPGYGHGGPGYGHGDHGPSHGPGGPGFPGPPGF